MKPRTMVTFALALFMLVPASLFASSHREAPISALDHAADVTDWYAFVSYDHPDRVTMILNVDGFLEPSNGPNYFPFDPNVLYEMHVDNDRDGIPDVTFQFRFKTEIRMPGVFTGFVGGIAGIPPITSLTGKGSEGLSLRQTYSVVMIKNGVRTVLSEGKTLYAVPSNVGPQTMPQYDELFRQGVFDLGNDVRVFAGTVDDPFFIDLGCACGKFRKGFIGWSKHGEGTRALQSINQAGGLYRRHQRGMIRRVNGVVDDVLGGIHLLSADHGILGPGQCGSRSDGHDAQQ